MRRWPGRHALVTLAIVGVAAGCGGGTPTSPATTPASTAQVPLGPQTLRVLASCASPTPVPTVPLLYTRVTVSRAGADWIASAGSDSGDVELRFHQTGVTAIGSMMVAGTIKGTAINVPGLAGLTASGNGRVTFGSGGGAEILGFAFNASPLFPTAGLDGTGTGTIAFSDDAGGSCATTAFTWAMFQ